MKLGWGAGRIRKTQLGDIGEQERSVTWPAGFISPVLGSSRVGSALATDILLGIYWAHSRKAVLFSALG